MVPVLVQDKNGNHIGGLSTNDFVLQEEGKPQKIAIFEEVRPENGLIERQRASDAQEFNNQVAVSPATRRLTVIALDAGSSGVVDQRRARDAMLKYLSQTVKSSTPTAVVLFSWNGIRLVHDFSSQPDNLRAALTGLEPVISGKDSGPAFEHFKLVPYGAPTDGSLDRQPSTVTNEQIATLELLKFSRDPDGIYRQFDREKGISSTLENFAHLARSLAGIPGRKEVIWVTAAFPYSITNPEETDSGDYSLAYKRTFQLLNEANVAVYPVDVRGLLVQVFGDISTCNTCGKSLTRGMVSTELISTPNLALTDRAADIATLESFARMTGGKAFYNRNDVDKSMDAANRDASGYYMLGYYSGSVPAKAEWRRLKVRSTQDALRLRARSGYFALPDAEAAGDPDLEIKQAALSQVQYTALPISVKILETTDKGDQKVIKARITVPPNTISIDESQNGRVLVEFVGVARDTKGEVKGNFSQTFRGNLKPEDLPRFNAAGVNYNNAFELSPGEYSLRFVVRDGVSGRIGSVIVPVTAR
jgi:VWFA-related protein